MEKKGKKKPLRQAQNAAKDLYNAYKKNEEKIIDINDMKDIEEMELEEKVKEAIQEEEEINMNELPQEPEHDEATDEEIHTLENSVESFKSENERLKESLSRKTAEMENMRRRTEKEKSELIKYANEKLLMNLLEIPDNIKQALDSAEKSEDFNSLKEGIELIYKKTFQLFEEAGVKGMEDLTGKEFDYELHEALLHTPHTEIPDNHIIQVVQQGYMYNDKVLRHAKVITSSGSEE